MSHREVFVLALVVLLGLPGCLEEPYETLSQLYFECETHDDCGPSSECHALGSNGERACFFEDCTECQGTCRSLRASSGELRPFCGPPCNPDDAPPNMRCTSEKGGPPRLECGQFRFDCNGTLEDGCEIDLRTDPKNCGECNHICGPGGATYENVAHHVCTNGACLIGECAPGFLDCDSQTLNGCEARLGDCADCLADGEEADAALCCNGDPDGDGYCGEFDAADCLQPWETCGPGAPPCCTGHCVSGQVIGDDRDFCCIDDDIPYDGFPPPNNQPVVCCNGDPDDDGVCG